MPRKKRVAASSAKALGFAVVGLGHISQKAVLPAFKHAGKSARLVALVSGDEEKRQELAGKYGVRKIFTYEQYDDCLADEEVAAVYIALPNNMHAEYTERAARAGVHVLCEKPMALSEEECERMIRACDEADVRLMIAYRLHFEEANLKTIELAKEGRLGDLKFFDSVFSYQIREGNIRTQQELGGGPVWDIGIYCINAARALFRSEPFRVYGSAARSDDPRFAEIDETVSATLEFPDNRLATFTCSYGSAATGSYRLVGAEGQVLLDNAYEYEGKIIQTVTVGDKSRRRTFPERDQFAAELIAFARCVSEGENPEPSGWEGLADVRIIRAIHQSIVEGKPIHLPPFERETRPEPSRKFIDPPRATPSW